MLRHCLAVLAGLCMAGPASASWADSMFESLIKDFGSVPRGPRLTHLFRLTNHTGSPVHISGVRVSCGCVTAQALQEHVAPGQSTVIIAQMDTTRFSGAKSVTLYVSFDQPRDDTVRLWVQANSRDDVSIAPASLAFGQVKRGAAPAASVQVTLMGGGAWQIADARCDSNYVQTTLEEVRRTPAEVTYKLTAVLRPDAPVGKWYSDVWLKTTHNLIPRVRVPLTVEIESALSITPSTVVLGETKVGGRVERKAILQGVRPFRIIGFSGTDETLEVRDSATDGKPVHVLTIILKPNQAGEINRNIRVITDLPEQSEIDFQARARVTP